jgi:hypothetical protein
MPELGTKHECFSCGAKFYDLGNAEAICPRCGANQKDATPSKPSYEASSRRKRREEPVRRAVEEEVDDSLTPPREGDVVADDVELDDEELETPEGEDEDDDLDDD